MINVLVIGETCVDRFVYGSVNRISPEAPVPIFVPIESKENSGMSGNVVENLKALADINITHITNENKITKTRYVDKKSNHMFMRVDEGDNLTVGHFDLENLKKKLILNYIANHKSEFDVFAKLYAETKTRRNEKGV